MRIVRETGKPIAQVAKHLGINAGTLANWVQMDRLAREQDTNGGEPAESEREELASLRRQRTEWAKERAELEMERDVLERSVECRSAGADEIQGRQAEKAHYSGHRGRAR